MSENEAPSTPDEPAKAPEGETPATPEAPPAPPPSGEPAAPPTTEGAATADEKTVGPPPASDEAEPRRKRRRRRKKDKEREAPSRPAKGSPQKAERKSPLEALGEGLGWLSNAYLDLRARTGGGRLEDARTADSVELTLKIPLKRAAIKEMAQALHDTLREGLEQRVLSAGLLVPGRAWCFSTESFDSDYCRPEDPRQVLVGYGLEGRPRYADLVTLAIERKHESVDDLLAGKEGAVSFVESGKTVSEGVRPAFDPDSIPYRLVAQAVCGLFESSEEGRRVALTLQVLAHDDEAGKLQLLAHPVSAVDLMDLPDPGIRRILRSFQHKLVQLAQQLDGKKAAGEEVDVEEEVLPHLREVARRLAQDAKNRERKTNHARERSAEGQRPTQLAFPEARSARDHHLYIDNEEQTMVVVGKKGRIHVFSPDGRHVTTLVMSPASVRQRVKAGRWRQAEPAERGAFREAVKGVEEEGQGRQEQS
jgi:hypothetical protein